MGDIDDDELSFRFMTLDIGLMSSYKHIHSLFEKNESKVYFNLRLRFRIVSFRICK